MSHNRTLVSAAAKVLDTVDPSWAKAIHEVARGPSFPARLLICNHLGGRAQMIRKLRAVWPRSLSLSNHKMLIELCLDHVRRGNARRFDPTEMFSVNEAWMAEIRARL